MLELVCHGHKLTSQIHLAPGTRLEALGEGWLAFSALSGETHRLNPEAAAVLDLLATGSMDESHLCALLAAETGADAETIRATLHEVWPSLEAAGLIRTGPAGRCA